MRPPVRLNDMLDDRKADLDSPARFVDTIETLEDQWQMLLIFHRHHTYFLASIVGEVWFIGMARMSRIVSPGFPSPIIQRGNRRQEAFFSDGDYQAYRAPMSEWCSRFHIELWVSYNRKRQGED
jgi:hypothetical protein